MALARIGVIRSVVSTSLRLLNLRYRCDVDWDSMNTDGLHDDTHRLSLLFSFSFDTSSLPDIWKIAVVCPVFKKGMSSDVSNYRPISLTSIVCKTMEAIVKDQFISYMLANDNHQATTRFSQ